MNVLVSLILTCSSLTWTNAVPLASGVIRWDVGDRIIMPGFSQRRLSIKQDPGTTTTTFNPPLVFGNIESHGSQAIPISFVIPNQPNEETIPPAAVLDNNTELNAAVLFSEQGNDDTSSFNEGSDVASNVHFPGQRPINPAVVVNEDEGSGDRFIFPSLIKVKLDSPEESTVTFSSSSGGTSSTPGGGSSNDEQCGPQSGSVYINGTCLTYLSGNVCPENEWLVKTNENTAECAPRPCPLAQLLYEGTCVDVANETVCRDGQMLYVDFTGYVHCDCQPNFIFDPWKGKCFAQGDQASCNVGEYLYIEESDGTVQCKRNPCLMDGYVFHNASGRCFRKMYKGFCNDSLLITNVRNLTAECSTIIWHSIFDLPAMRSCARGSQRDYSGRCRETFRVPSVSSYPVLYGQCPGIGFVKDSRGICRRTHKLFG